MLKSEMQNPSGNFYLYSSRKNIYFKIRQVNNECDETNNSLTGGMAPYPVEEQ